MICTIQNETKCPPAFYCPLLHGLSVPDKEIVEFHGHGHARHLLMAWNYGIVLHYCITYRALTSPHLSSLYITVN